MPSPQPATEPTKQPLLPTAPVSRSEAGIAPTADDSPEAPWWVKPTTTQPIRGGTGKPAGADTPQPPSRPPTRPVPKPAPVPDPKPRVKPWLVVSLIALVAIGAGVATVALLRPPAVEQILTGVPGNPLGEDEIMGSPSDLAAPWVKVKDEVIPLTLDDWKYTGHFCTMGAEYRITAHGEGSMHDGVPVGPEGLGEGESSEAPSYPAFPLASLLVGVRGSDTLVYVGSDGSYTCPSGSEMKLGVNDLNVEANSGQFNATIWKLSEQ